VHLLGVTIKGQLEHDVSNNKHCFNDGVGTGKMRIHSTPVTADNTVFNKSGCFDKIASWVQYYSIIKDPSLQICNPAYLVPVPSQDKLGRVTAGRASGVKLGR